MIRRVLDSSVTMAWCFEDETSDYADAALSSLAVDEAVVPSIWPLEVVNVLTIAERKGRTDRTGVGRFVTALSHLPIKVDDQTTAKAFSDILSLARTHQLTSYDAAYLELAIREGLELATLDEPLRRAAVAAGVRLFATS